MSRFDEFWAAWPKNQRKVGRSQCADKWKSRNLDAIADTIISHVEWSKSKNKQWHEGVIPMPMTYINQSRWEAGMGEEDLKPRPRAKGPEERKREEDNLPKVSRYGRYANKLLLNLIKKHAGLGERLPGAVQMKNQIVRDAEEAFFMGDPWADDEFISVITKGLNDAINISSPDADGSNRVRHWQETYGRFT